MDDAQVYIGCVYEILNTQNGKRYVGSTAQHPFTLRWDLHKRHLAKQKHHSIHLQRAWNLYGEASFQFSVLIGFIQIPLKTLLKYEQFYIDSYQTCNPNQGYNMVPLAGSNKGHKMSDEAKLRISKSLQGRKFTKDHKQKIAMASSQFRHTDATKAKLKNIAKNRIPQKGRPCKSETRVKIGIALSGEKNFWYGKHLPDEIRKKIGDKSKGNTVWLGRKHSNETKQKQALARTGKILSEASRQKITQSRKGFPVVLITTKEKIDQDVIGRPIWKLTLKCGHSVIRKDNESQGKRIRCLQCTKATANGFVVTDAIVDLLEKASA